MKPTPWQLIVVSMGILGIVPLEIRADLIIFTTSQSQFDPGVDNQGWWSGTHANIDSNDHYGTGRFINNNYSLRSFFTFDLASLGAPDVITSATLRLRRFDSSEWNESTETLGFFDVSTPVAVLNDNDGTSSTIYNDLGTGTSYGHFTVSGSGNPSAVLSFTLNAAALSDLNAAKGGFFSLGGSLLSQDGDDWIFGNSSSLDPQELILNVENVATVPEPSSLILISMATATLAGYCGWRKRKRVGNI